VLVAPFAQLMLEALEFTMQVFQPFPHVWVAGIATSGVMVVVAGSMVVVIAFAGVIVLAQFVEFAAQFADFASCLVAGPVRLSA
jgi:hypothetical protein